MALLVGKLGIFEAADFEAVKGDIAGQYQANLPGSTLQGYARPVLTAGAHECDTSLEGWDRTAKRDEVV